MVKQKNLPLLVIEHLEPLTKFVWLEYRHISKLWQKKVLFTNVKSLRQRKKLRALGRVTEKSIVELYKVLGRGCVLDPQAKVTLTSEEAKSYDYFVLGGICGDFPARGRTFKLITSKLQLPARNLGKEQLSTDTAALVLKEILEGKGITELSFVKPLVIKLSRFEEVELPFAYLIKNHRPVITPGLIEYLRRAKRV